jgi:hypothetical protein
VPKHKVTVLDSLLDKAGMKVNGTACETAQETPLEEPAETITKDARGGQEAEGARAETGKDHTPKRAYLKLIERLGVCPT